MAARRSRPFASVQDLVDRTDVHRDELPRLAETGALNAFGLTRRSALWQVEKAGRPRGSCSGRRMRAIRNKRKKQSTTHRMATCLL